MGSDVLQPTSNREMRIAYRMQSPRVEFTNYGFPAFAGQTLTKRKSPDSSPIPTARQRSRDRRYEVFCRHICKLRSNRAIKSNDRPAEISVRRSAVPSAREA